MYSRLAAGVCSHSLSQSFRRNASFNTISSFSHAHNLPPDPTAFQEPARDFIIRRSSTHIHA